MIDLMASAGSDERTRGVPGSPRIVLLGNPNTGKTTLFNRLTGLRHKTSNFPGTTQEARVGRALLAPGREAELVDLPGVYSLDLDQNEAEVCRSVLDGVQTLPGEGGSPDGVCVVVDATNLGRNLLLVGEVLRRRLPTVVALNMTDLARRRGLHIDVAELASRLGCGVVPISARSGEGVEQLRASLGSALIPNRTPPGSRDGLEGWADEVFAACASSRADGAQVYRLHDRLTDRLDRVLTHPVLGTAAFVAVMFGLFYTIFSLARLPMSLIEHVFGSLAGWARAALGGGILATFVGDGVLGGIGATLIFLPQICLLFLLISLLEDTGYLARAAFVMNRALRPFGLSGHAFVPLLSSHACALPGIMSCRAIPDPRERLAAILSAPFMSCSARIPVYVLLTSLLFPDSSLRQSLAFCGCYALGIVAGLLSSLVARRTVARGPRRPMALELPTYKLPSLRTAGTTMIDRGLVFLKQAGTNILAICIILWWLSAFPHAQAPARAAELRASVATLADSALAPVIDPGAVGIDPVARTAGDVRAEANRLEARATLENSFAGRLGRFIEPAFRPLGFDWQLSVGIVTSFAAREVFVSTMAVITSGESDARSPGVMRSIARAKRDDGRALVFTPATSVSLLVYYVLAMQCLPTLAVTAREAGGARWALLQLGWMGVLAYAGAWIARATLIALGVA